MTTQHKTRRLSAALGLLLLFSCQSAYSYSVLTHEAIVDSTWDSAILYREEKRTQNDRDGNELRIHGGCFEFVWAQSSLSQMTTEQKTRRLSAARGLSKRRTY